MINPSTILRENVGESGGKPSNIIFQLTKIYDVWNKLQGRYVGASFQKAATIFQKGFIGTPFRLYRNGTLYQFCTRDIDTFSVCSQLVLQLFAAVGTPSTAVAIQQMVRTIAMHPVFAIEFVHDAVVPPLLEASKQLKAEATEVINIGLEGIFGSEVTVTTIGTYTTADLQNMFRGKHSEIIEAVAGGKETQIAQGSNSSGGKRIRKYQHNLSFTPRKRCFSSPYIKSSFTMFIVQNDKVKENTEEDYEFKNNRGWYVKKEFGRIVEEREVSPAKLNRSILSPFIKNEWREVQDEEGRIYYWNTQTGETVTKI